MRLEIARGRDNAPLMLDGQFVGPGMKDLFGLGVLEPAALAFALDLRPILRVIRDQPLAHGLKLRVGGHDGRIGTKYGRDIISSVGQLVYLLPVAAAFCSAFLLCELLKHIRQDFYYCFRYVLAILMPCDGGVLKVLVDPFNGCDFSAEQIHFVKESMPCPFL